MKVTPTMLRVLRAVEERDGCGARTIDEAMWPDSMRPRYLRAGQYAGKLVRRGLLRKTYDEYRGKRGQLIAMSVAYTLTALAREILKSEQ